MTSKALTKITESELANTVFIVCAFLQCMVCIAGTNCQTLWVVIKIKPMQTFEACQFNCTPSHTLNGLEGVILSTPKSGKITQLDTKCTPAVSGEVHIRHF